MYIEQQARLHDQETAGAYLSFLRSCNIQVNIRPYAPMDVARVKELLTRTHRMNLGVLSPDEAINRLESAEKDPVLIAEMRDKYGDMGRCAVLHLKRDGEDKVVVQSLAISCRTRARGLSLATLVGLLRHHKVQLGRVGCRFISNGLNRPLRMLLMAAGFQRQPDTDELILYADRLASTDLPDWINVSYS